ncbi:MAG: tRNA lysidine(34) synthetase TilS [Colwellia sp.]|nr:tRNA lysidine(34) synthetase TilS [Colwellia sp.]MCW9080594.1 tRNA lysidine(34) synthetase TilS [Colwellia sp.]
MSLIESALLSAMSKYAEMPLIVAYSGGVDSQVLLHALASLKQKKSFLNPITVCHVNHGLSENAAQWQNFAEQQCQQMNLPLVTCQVNVQAQAQKSLEALARDARYAALQSLSTSPSVILTGHHSDDQAETFLLALKRGSGLKGLSSMASSVQQGKDLLVRPLLDISRADITEYARKYGLTWVEDESNLDSQFDRNFIRNTIMPLLVKRWPSIATTINRSGEHCAEGQLLLDELAVEDLKVCQYDEYALSVKALKKLSAPRFNNLIRYFLTLHHCLMPSTEQLAQLHQQLSASNDKNPAVKVGKHYFRRFKDAIYLTEDFNDVSYWQVEVDLSCDSEVIELPDNVGKLNVFVTSDEYSGNRQIINESEYQILAPAQGQKVTIRFKHDNPTCLPDYRNHSRSLKKVIQELNIPPWQRRRIPFLYYDDVFVAAIGYFVCQAYTVKASLPEISEPSLTVAWHQ